MPPHQKLDFMKMKKLFLPLGFRREEQAFLDQSAADTDSSVETPANRIIDYITVLALLFKIGGF